MPDIHAIILTLNEEKHLARCIESIHALCASITIVDSGSADRTVEIARAFSAEVITNKFINHATQMNFGIDHVARRDGWILRIDADEYLTKRSATALPATLTRVSEFVDGVLVQRQIVFLGRRIRWGGVEPNWQLRLWRCGKGICEQRWMDEHIVVRGEVVRSNVELVDENLNSLDWWTEKHNRYASREVMDILTSRGLLPGACHVLVRSGASPQARVKRLIKDRIYNRLPGGLRSVAYLCYRYILRLGFLDGAAGYYFHILQGFWYRSLVDAKLREVLTLSKSSGVPVAEALRRTTGVDLTSSS